MSSESSESSGPSIPAAPMIKTIDPEIPKSWQKFVEPQKGSNMPSNIDVPSWADMKSFNTVKARLIEARAQAEEGGVLHGLGLSDGEMTALLLCTKEHGPFEDMQTALSSTCKKDRDAQKWASLAATLVSALRKLRTRPIDVTLVRAAPSEPLVECEGHVVAYPFVRATTMVPLGGFADGSVLVPDRMRVPVIPECLCFAPDNNNVLLEPGTTFTKAFALQLYEQVKPAEEEQFLLFSSNADFPPLLSSSSASV